MIQFLNSGFPGCGICGNHLIPFKHNNSIHDLGFCEQCGHCQFLVMPSKQSLTEYYKKQYGLNCNQVAIQTQNIDYYISHYKELLNFAKINSGSFLDYGSSYPDFLIQVRKYPLNKAIGVDWDESAIAYGKSAGIEMLTPDQMATIENKSIDVIRCSHVLEHEIDPLKTIRCLVSKLKPGGILYITQPSFPQIDLNINSNFLHDVVYPEHLHFFSPASLMHLTSATGLKTIRFFTHTDNKEVQVSPELLRIDQLAKFKDDFLLAGDSFFGIENNYPYFSGKCSYYIGSA
jgi:SAM-dependent methyltransferase